MTEQSMSIQPNVGSVMTPDQETAFRRRRNRLASVTTAVMVSAGLVMAACGNSPHDSNSAEPAAVTTTVENNANICNNFDLSRNLAERNYGAPEAVLPALTDNQGTEKVPVTADIASQRIRTNVEGDVWALSLMDTLRETRDETRQTLKTVVTRTHDKFNKYSGKNAVSNDTKKAAAQVCSALNSRWLKPTDNFTVNGAGVEIQAVRDSKGNVIGFEAQNITSAGVLKGFLWEGNLDDKSLDTTDKAHRISVAQDVLIGEDGTIIIKGLTQEQLGGFILTPKEQKQVPVAPKNQNQNNQSSQNNQNNNSGGGQFGNSNGQGESNQPGNVHESGGNGGVTSGTTPSFGGGGGETSTTPVTGGSSTTETTSANTTTTTLPSTTTTQPATTTSQPTPTTKGTVPGFG